MSLTLSCLHSFVQKTSQLSPQFKDMMVAGGAPRDIMVGGEVKDIDLFIPTAEGEIWMTHAAIIQCFPKAVQEFPQYLNSHYSRPEMVSVWATGEFLDGKPIQLVVVSQDKSDVLPSLDIGICQIGVSAAGVHYTAGYLQDLGARTLTVLRCENDHQAERTALRLGKILRKYPCTTPDWGVFESLKKDIYGFRY